VKGGLMVEKVHRLWRNRSTIKEREIDEGKKDKKAE
jgi:hypothetical protein